MACEPLEAPENGEIYCFGNQYGDACFISCNDGYDQRGHFGPRSCEADRLWSGHEVVCIGKFIQGHFLCVHINDYLSNFNMSLD